VWKSTHGVRVSHPVMWKVVGRALAELQPTLNPSRLIFLDETWATTNMAPTCDWAPNAERLVRAVPHGHWNTTTFLCGLRTTGLVAPLVLDQAINGPAFLAYVRQFLARELLLGDVVVLDNLSSRKVSGVREASEARGTTLLYLPPHSPDLDPSELVVSKLQGLPRDAGKRTVEALWQTIGRLLQRLQ
jgi:transposase